MSSNKKKRLNVAMSAPYSAGLALLINDGLYESEAEVVKDALRRLFNHYDITVISEACQ